MQITLENIGRRFNREWIFKAITYAFNNKGRYAVLGSNGSGKSTLLQVLNGSLVPSAGVLRYSYQGKNIEPEILLDHIGDDEATLDVARELLNASPARNNCDAIEDVLHRAENCVFSLRNMAITNRITEISREANHAEQSGDSALFNRLTYEQLELEKIRRTLQHRITEL